MIHGEEEATKAKAAAEALFGAGNNMDNVPTKEISRENLGVELTEFLSVNKVLKNKSEGRRLIEQNGMSVNDEKISDVKYAITEEVFGEKDYIMVKMGKKRFLKIVLK